MLEIQRASAGSGKTYALTKEYIWLFITIPVDEEPVERGEERQRRLRTPEEMAGAHSHILAITFTNKATEEMQSRIVESLADLSSEKPAEEIDYLEDFAAELHVDEREVRKACREALAILLNEYTDFNVTTIDSFFQLVLRTFAYESDINDSYSIEIDSDYIIKAGIDELLTQVNAGKTDKETTFWVRKLMHDGLAGNKKWNLFQKSGSRFSIYSMLSDIAAQISKENYQNKRPLLNEYFNRDDIPPFSEVYMQWEKHFADRQKALLDAWLEKAQKYIEIFDATVDIEGMNKTLIGQIEKIKEGIRKKKAPKIGFKSVIQKNTCMKKNHEGGDLDIAGVEQYKALGNYYRELEAEDFRLWDEYSRSFSFLALLRSIEHNVTRFLEENNMVELGKTNTLLRRIIGNDEAPFIYERIGTYLNHFLIDEFQDTSPMQWCNLRPLLKESDGRGHENLIIGDAKQSIYRFRNADYKLITEVVPRQFDDVRYGGSGRNFRSLGNIVRFNNSLFEQLALRLDEVNNLGNRVASLYSRIVQKPKYTGKEGYIEIVEKRSASGSNVPEWFADLGDLVQSLLRRGFEQRDIAFLVAKNTEGEAIINSFIEYNSSLSEGDEKINFVSEESLKISTASSVKGVIAALQVIRDGFKPMNSLYTDSRKRKKNLAAASSLFRHYSSLHPELSNSDRLRNFFSGDIGDGSLDSIIGSLRSIALPSLVEALLATEVRKEHLDAEAPFVAAFMDLVLEYCESYPADIASFISWWEKRGCDKSISFPEDTNAVKVLTIHKSKGLQFDCVILPNVAYNFRLRSKKKEKIWVNSMLEKEGLPALPPVVMLSVGESTNLDEGVHGDEITDVKAGRMIDAFNAFYVGMTRAKKELYVFTGSSTMHEDISAVAGAMEDGTSDHLAPGDVLCETDDATGMSIYVCGEKKHKSEYEDEREKVLKARMRSGADVKPAVREIGNMGVNLSGPMLTYKKDDDISVGAMTSSNDEDEDSRSRGNLMHQAMEWISYSCDVEKAVSRLRISGKITREEQADIEAELKKALADPRVKAWFEPPLRIFSERPILKAKRDARPDRVVVDAKGNGIVIDYKFGHERKDKEYKAQVRGYMIDLQKCVNFSSIRGYVWYVTMGEIVEVSPAEAAAGSHA